MMDSTRREPRASGQRYDLRMGRKDILSLLKGGDRRSIGKANRVAAIVADNPRKFAGLIAGLWSDDPLVRMRAADAAEKVTRSRPGLLRPHRKELLGLMAETAEPEIRWHLALMAPRLALTLSDIEAATASLRTYLDSRSSIVKTCALQGLAELAQRDPSLWDAVIELLRRAARGGTAAMKARSRKLLAEMEGDS